MIWIIIGLLIAYSIGYIQSAWYSSKKIVNLEDNNKALNIENEELNKELVDINHKINAFPFYDIKG